MASLLRLLYCEDRQHHSINFLDSAPCHGTIARLPESPNISVLFLPKRTTSRLKSLDAGVIFALKRRYRSRFYEQDLDLL